MPLKPCPLPTTRHLAVRAVWPFLVRKWYHYQQGSPVYTAAISGYKGLWLVCRTIANSMPVLKKLAHRKLFRPSRLVGSYVSPFLFGPGK